MERFVSQIIEGVTEAARTLGEAFDETDDDPPAASTVDNAGCLECDDDHLKAIAEDYNQEGDARLNKDKFANALDFYTNGIQLKCKDDQLNATMYTNRARVHFCLGNFDEALSDVRSARELQPLHLEAIELGASTCMELALYKEVIKWCDEGLAIDNRSKKLRDLKSRSMKIQAYQDTESDDDMLLRGIADGHNKDGNEELRNNEFDSAIDCYTEGIKVECKDDRLNAVLYTNRATVHSLVGNYDDALRDAKCARKFQPTFVKAILTGARACFELAMFEDAVTWCNDGLAIDKEEKTMLELRERSLIELCHLRKGEEDNASTSSQNNLGLDWTLEKLMDFPGNYHRSLRRMIGGNEYDTVYFRTDLSIYSLKGLKKGVNKFKRWFNLNPEETVENGSDGQVAGFSCLPGGKDMKLMIGYYELQLSLNKEMGYKAGEGRAYDNLGIALQMSGDYEQAIVCHKEHLSIALELKDRAGEGRAYGNLGIAYYSMNDMEQAVDFFKLNLSISKEVGQRASEGRACSVLGLAHATQGKFEEAENYFKRHLDIARELGDRSGEGLACGNLGLVYGYQEEFQKALEYGEQFLSIAKEIGNRDWEGVAYGNLGVAYHNLSDMEHAIDYYKMRLSIVTEMGRREEEQQVYTCLGDAYCSRRDFKQAAEYHRLSLNIAKELGDRFSEAKAYGSLSYVYSCLNDYKKTVEYGTLNLTISKEEGIKSEEAAACQRLGNAFLVLGNVEKALSYYEQCLHVVTEVGDLSGEGCAYGRIGTAYQSLGQLDRAIEYHQRHLYIAEEMENTTEQGHAYRNMGVAYQSLGEYKQAIERFEEFLRIAKNEENRENEGIVYGDLGDAYVSLGDFQRAIHYQELRLNIAEEVGSKVEQGNAFCALGSVYEELGNLPKAFTCFQSSVQLFKDVKACFQSKDDWKINFQDNYQFAYIGSWRVLVKQEKWIDALLTAEEGRAQALMDLMTSQYGLQGNLPESDPHENGMLDLPPNTLFLALDENMLSCWLLLENNEVLYRAEEIVSERGTNAKEFFQSLNNHIFEEIEITAAVRCEDRSLDALRQDIVARGKKKADQTMPQPFHRKYGALRWLYEIIIEPFVDLLKGNELIIVPDGPLCLTPFCVLLDSNSRFLCETLRLRVVPSLSSLRMILNCSDEYHCRNSALLVGDPLVEEVVINGEKLPQLPFARTEVEMIRDILWVDPLIGARATKDEVLRRLQHVALVHIAAHGCMQTGEIALCPNPARASRIPEEDDFVLTMSDVLEVKLRARLVVLSCCHSGQGNVKAEGVVGIARAFLAAGARSVLASLWAIDDKATLEFMRSFYQNLLVGRRASEALNQAMECLRESHNYSDVKYWAPFVLIGDDPVFDFGYLT